MSMFAVTHSLSPLRASSGTQDFHKRAPLLSVYGLSGDGFPGQSACLHLFLHGLILYKSMSFSMVLRQVSLGRPRFRFPSGVQRMAILGSASGGIRHTCPSHLHLLFLRDFAFVLWCSSFEILLGQKILRISKHLFWKVCILWTILVVSFQHSAPYSKTLRTLLLKILSLVLVPTF